MFATLSRFRRRIAVLTALAMVASVLVAVPAVAADPKADFPATFDACMDAPPSGFEDVPTTHSNAGDIDCIAYYGITKGTSATTYSPQMAVTREHMALFLTRLAGLVGISLVSNPDDPGFTDIGDLSAESQTAIAQLADLGITQGTSDTTFSPGDNVRRDHMALFIQRLMNNMSPLADGNTKHGRLPSDVAKATENVASPYTDLGGATKSAYDAVTQLYELEVVSGISATAYAPAADITRASMAEFMAGVLDHSNARPAGLSIQASKSSAFGEITDAVVMVSYRSDDLMPMAQKSVDIFNSEADDGGLGDDGTCKATDGPNAPVGGTACEQDDNDAQTDEMGNIFTTGTATEGKTNVYTAWTGDSGDKFDADDVDEVSVSITAKQDVTALHVTSTISDNADASDYDSDASGGDENLALEDSGGEADEPRVDLDVTDSVTFTVQLRDTNGDDVAKSDVSVMITVAMTGNTTSTNTHTVKTDDDGMVSYTIDAPSDNDSDNRRLDVVTFATTGVTTDVVKKILWLEDDPALTTAKASVSTPYAVISGSGDAVTAKVAASVMLYDQYGNIHKAAGQQVAFAIPTTAATPVTRSAASGRASYTGTATGSTDVVAGTAIAWTATVTVPDGDDADTDRDAGPAVDATGASVVPVNNAGDDSTASAVAVTALYDKQNKFHSLGTLYGYDSDDTFLNGGSRITMDKFEELLGKGITVGAPASINVVLYDDDGASIFNVISAATE